MTFHTVIITGNLGRDPEMRYTPSGQAVTNLSVAVNDDYTNSSGERVKRTIWFRVSAWGKQAEVCNQYLQKGSKVLVQGRLNVDPATGGPRIWSGQDGQSRASYELSAQTVRFLTPRGSEPDSTIEDSGGDMPTMDDDNIPF